jgi:hypothetical protein
MRAASPERPGRCRKSRKLKENSSRCPILRRERIVRSPSVCLLLRQPDLDPLILVCAAKLGSRKFLPIDYRNTFVSSPTPICIDMSTNAEREPLLAATSRDDSKNQDRSPKPGTVLQMMVVGNPR